MRKGLMLFAAGLLWTAAALPGHAAFFTVDTTADESDVAAGDGVCQTASGACALRAAVEEANSLVGADGIVVPAGTYAVPPLQVTDAVVIGGAGAEDTIVSSGSGTAFTTVDTDLALLDLTVTGGQGVNVGGGVANNGGQLTIINCVIRNSTAGNVGGGIYNNESSVLTVIGSTIRDNFAFNVGGGIANNGTAHLINSTISGNWVVNTGGGIHNDGSMRLTNCTVTRNGAVNTRGGIDNDNDGAAPIRLENTIAADNRLLFLDPIAMTLTDIGQSVDCAGAAISNFHNLIQENWCGLGGVGDIVGVDAQLGPLQDNGGQTPTHALLTGSPAIDTASASECPGTDQRGIFRPQGAECDIGAYEAGPCGNGLPDLGEACDDGNGVNGDGCDSNCTATACGNGITTAGEQCDDGNLLDGDCCSSACALTVDDDLLPAVAGGSTVFLRESGSGMLKWKWEGAAPTTMAEFGDPTDSTTYTLCLVDESGGTPSLVLTAAAPAAETCNGKPCWRRTSSGFNYKGLDGPGRVAKVKLKAGPGGASIFVKGKGRRLRLGRLPLLLPVRVVLRKSEGATGFGAAFAGPRLNALDQFKATSD